MQSWKAVGFFRLLRRAGLTVLASSSVVAQDSSYSGVNAGPAKANIDYERTAGTLLAGGFTATSSRADQRATGYKIFAGFQLNRHLALEGGYFDLGVRLYGHHGRGRSFSGDVKFKGFNHDVVGIVPISEKFAAVVRAGANRTQASTAFTGTGLVNALDARRSTRATR